MPLCCMAERGVWTQLAPHWPGHVAWSLPDSSQLLHRKHGFILSGVAVGGGEKAENRVGLRGRHCKGSTSALGELLLHLQMAKPDPSLGLWLGASFLFCTRRS